MIGRFRSIFFVSVFQGSLPDDGCGKKVVEISHVIKRHNGCGKKVVEISHVIERRNKRTAKNLELGKSLKKERMSLSTYRRVSENLGLQHQKKHT